MEVFNSNPWDDIFDIPIKNGTINKPDYINMEHWHFTQLPRWFDIQAYICHDTYDWYNLDKMFPYKVLLNDEYQRKNLGEVVDWIVRNLSGRWFRAQYFCFENREDALKFKLTWR